MTTVLELPEELVNEIKLRAVHQGQKLNAAVADLLRKGLAADGVSSAMITGDQSLLERRREVAEKFVSGEWGAELAGFEEGRTADREAARATDRLWRS